MADIGIDLGTATVLVYDSVKGLLIKEPSVVAVDASTGEVLKVGEEAFKMIGRTPDRIRALYPLKDGVISDFDQTEQMLRHFLKKASESTLSKPRVCICVPSGITGVESMEELYEQMLAHRFSEALVQDIFFHNLHRFLGEAL